MKKALCTLFVCSLFFVADAQFEFSTGLATNQHQGFGAPFHVGYDFKLSPRLYTKTQLGAKFLHAQREELGASFRERTTEIHQTISYRLVNKPKYIFAPNVGVNYRWSTWRGSIDAATRPGDIRGWHMGVREGMYSLSSLDGGVEKVRRSNNLAFSFQMQNQFYLSNRVWLHVTPFVEPDYDRSENIGGVYVGFIFKQNTNNSSPLPKRRRPTSTANDTVTFRSLEGSIGVAQSSFMTGPTWSVAYNHNLKGKWESRTQLGYKHLSQNGTGHISDGRFDNRLFELQQMLARRVVDHPKYVFAPAVGFHYRYIDWKARLDLGQTDFHYKVVAVRGDTLRMVPLPGQNTAHYSGHHAGVSFQAQNRFKLGSRNWLTITPLLDFDFNGVHPIYGISVGIAHTLRSKPRKPRGS